jgi:hypothetical protein
MLQSESREAPGDGSGCGADDDWADTELSSLSNGQATTCGPEPRPKDGTLIDKYATHGLPSLNYKPLLLRNWVLVGSTLINIGWIVWLAIVYTRPLSKGPEFILGGLFSGYAATVMKFFIVQQVFCIGKIMPYRNMLSATDRSARRTIDSDYWPYEWPVLRLRALRNKDYFYQAVEVIAFIFTYAVVQFESNILRPVYDDGDDYFLGYTPNHGVIIIALICHGVFAITTVSILVWLQLRETGLLADPGYLSLYLALFNKDDIQEDFQGFEDEDRRWIVRERLAKNQYRIGYWTKGLYEAVYGIRRTTNRARGSIPPKKRTKYPESRYVPWFLETFWVVIWTSILAAALAILATLVIRDDIIDSGFASYTSTKMNPLFSLSPAAFLWSFIPSFAADLFHILVISIDTFHRLVQPYADLKRKDANPDAIIKCFRINYTNDLPLVVTFRALKNGHVKVALISLFSLFASLTPAWAANMFYVDSNEWIAVWTQAFYPVVVYVSLLIPFLLWVIPDQSRYMPHDLETIADHMALLSQSSLLDDGRFQRKVKWNLGNNPHALLRVNAKSRLSTKVKSAFGVLTSIPESCRQIRKCGWKTIYTPAKKALIDPPDLVDEVTGEMDKHKLPRFGIWYKNGSFVIGIDSNADSKMISLFEDDFYERNSGETARSWIEHIF